MNPFQLVGGTVATFDAALKRPFVTALGSKTSTRNAALRLRLRGGEEGYGEASGSVVMARHTPAMLSAALRRLLHRFRGRDARGVRAGELFEACALPAAAAAFECALAEAVCAREGTTLAERFGGALDSVETDLTLSALPEAPTREAAAEARKAGFKVLKVKVGGGTPAEDLRRAQAAAEAGRAALILDGNQRLGASRALRLAEACLARGVRVLLLEQPLERGREREMARLRRRSPVPIAADESARSAREALEVLDLGAADVINVKVAKTGLAGSLEVVALARAAGARLMIGCMQESARGLAASVHLACGTGAFDWADLDSDLLLSGGPAGGGWRREGPRAALA